MKALFFFIALLTLGTSRAQVYLDDITMSTPGNFMQAGVSQEIKPVVIPAWKLDRNKYWTGALVFVAGASKGFNEGLQYQYNGFASFFPKANKQWFYPAHSFRNKYKDGDPAKGPKFPFSTSLLVMVTDQYHLNNFIQRTAFTGALVIKIGEGKRPLKHYIFDILYYTACYQAGFHSIYSPIRARNRK